MSEFKEQCIRRQQRRVRRIQEVIPKADALHFFNLLTGPQLLGSVEALAPEYRERQYPPTVTLAMFLGQVLSADGSCQNAVDAALVSRVLSGRAGASANTSGYCQARERLPRSMVRELAQRVAAELGAHAPAAWRWRGRPVKLVDGTTVLLADSADNQAAFPQQSRQERGAGFPLARLVGVISLEHGAVLDVAMGPCRGKGTGEYGLFRTLQGCLCAGDVLLADRYYCSYFLIASLLARGVDVVFEQHGARRTDFRTGERLGVREHVVHWTRPLAGPAWMSPEDYARAAPQLTLREVRVGGKILVTSFLKPREVGKRELGRLFRMRWNVELDLRNIKTTLGMERLACKSPSMCDKELWVYMLAYNLIRLLMAQAAHLAGVLPRQLSFKHTVQIWGAWSRRQFLSDGPEDPAVLFRLIAQVHVGRRPGRVEPRMLKQRPKPFPWLHTTRRHARARIRRYGHPRRAAA